MNPLDAIQQQLQDALFMLEHVHQLIEDLTQNPSLQNLLDHDSLQIVEDHFTHQYPCGCTGDCGDYYPCRCTTCNQLQAEGYKNIHLCGYALEQALLAVIQADTQLHHACDYQQQAATNFASAKECAKANCCKGYCK